MADWQTELTGANRDAAGALTDLFTSYGLGTLAPRIVEFIKGGYSSDTISLLLSETPEYQARFAGNKARLAKGLPALTPAEYLSVEQSYRQVMSAAGLPVGFYDQPEDFQKMIESDLAPQEVQQRVQAAADLVNKAPAEAKTAFGQWYSTGDMIAYALDPTRAMSAIEKAYGAATAAGYAGSQGVALDQARAEQLSTLGLTNNALSQGFGAIAQEQATAQKLAQIEGTSLTADDLIKETFLNDATAAEKRAKLSSAERGRFGGTSGAGSGSLARASSGSI